MRLAILLAMTLIATPAMATEAEDADYLANVMNTRLETQRIGVVVPWYNSFTGNGGNVTILGTNESDPEKPCRHYRLTTESPGGPTTVVEGRACRIENRLWERTESVVSATPRPDPAPVARAEPVPPPPQIDTPPRKPDPDVFFASVPTPSVY